MFGRLGTRSEGCPQAMLRADGTTDHSRNSYTRAMAEGGRRLRPNGHWCVLAESPSTSVVRGAMRQNHW